MTDGQRSADDNNPRGYFELEAVKSLARNQDVLAQAEGKVVKVHIFPFAQLAQTS